MTQPLALPPLPPPWQYMAFQIGDSNADGFTADQMHAYARQAQRDALEAAAKVCEDMGTSPYRIDDSDACAAAIRSLINP